MTVPKRLGILEFRPRLALTLPEFSPPVVRDPAKRFADYSAALSPEDSAIIDVFKEAANSVEFNNVVCNS